MLCFKRHPQLLQQLYQASRSEFSIHIARCSTVADLHSNIKNASEIPGPRKFPLIGNIPLMLSKDWNLNRIDLLHRNLFEKYGDIYTIHIPPQKFVFTKNPDDIKKIFKATMSNPIRPAFDSIFQVRTKELNYYFEKKPGIVVTNEEEWYRLRSQVQVPLLKVKNIQTFIPAMDEVARDFISRIEYIKDEHDEVGKDFLDELYRWGLESVATVALNLRLGCLEKDLDANSIPMKMISAVQEALGAVNTLEFGLPLYKFFPTKEYKILVRCTKVLIEYTNIELQVCLEKLKTKSPHEKPTLIEILLQNPELSFKDVATLILDMLIAGIDSTANTVAFTLYNLARNPECQRKLQKEIDEVVGDTPRTLTDNDLAKLSYLKAVVKETFRFFPLTFGAARQLTSDVELSGHLVPKGWLVVTGNLFAGFDEAQVARPKEFLPERWARDKPLGEINPFVVLPFSHGTRMCVGRRIAEQEIYLLLAKLLQNYNVEYHYKDMHLLTRLIFKPSEPCQFKFIKRKAS